MIGLCLASGALAAQIATASFTLAWMHSIEKVRWEEDWRVSANVLTVTEGRIHGSGAGMEPPPDAKLENRVWRYRLDRSVSGLDLAHSPYTAGYELCMDGACLLLADYLPGLPATATVHLNPCRVPTEAH